VTTIAKHVARKPLAIANATKTQISGRNKQLRERFPARQPEHCGADTAGTAEDTIVRLTSGSFTSDVKTTQAGRRRGVTKLLDWLATFPGDTWQQRWELSGVEQHPGKTWTGLPLTWLQERGQNASYDADDLASGLLMLICGDVIRPGVPWMLTRTHARLASAMAQTRDPQGFARLQRLAETQPASSAVDARVAATRIATILACKGGIVADVTVGDCVELVDTLRQVHARGGQKKVDFYLRLRTIGIFPRRRAAHDPRLRASHRAAHDRRISGSIPVALQTHSRPACRLPTGTSAVAGLRQHRRHLPQPGRAVLGAHRSHRTGHRHPAAAPGHHPNLEGRPGH
jgi:hypothetical protein